MRCRPPISGGGPLLSANSTDSGRHGLPLPEFRDGLELKSTDYGVHKMNQVTVDYLRTSQFHDLDPTEKARLLAALEPVERFAVFSELPPQEAVATFLHMDDEEQAGILEQMGQEAGARFAGRLPVYTVARSVALLTRRYGDELLARLPVKKREQVESILQHDEDSVIRVMRADPIVFAAETPVAEVMARLSGTKNGTQAGTQNDGTRGGRWGAGGDERSRLCDEGGWRVLGSRLARPIAACYRRHPSWPVGRW